MKRLIVLEIKHTMYEKEIDKSIISEYGTHLVILIEGDLIITFNGVLFFDESYVNLLELSVQLYKWIKRIFKNKFVYDSMENEDPIFTFTKMKNGYWEIDSIWKKSGSFQIKEKELYKFIKYFIRSLDMELRERYNIETADIIRQGRYCKKH